MQKVKSNKMAAKLFHTPKNKRFNYSPLYYDEKKEELEKRIRRIKQEMGKPEDEDIYIPNIKGQMRGGYFKRSQEQKRRSSFRLVFILVILFLIAYWLIFM